MSEPQDDLTGMWIDEKGSSRQVHGNMASPYDTVWSTSRRPGGWRALVSGSYILLKWRRANTLGGVR